MSDQNSRHPGYVAELVEVVGVCNEIGIVAYTDHFVVQNGPFLSLYRHAVPDGLISTAHKSGLEPHRNVAL